MRGPAGVGFPSERRPRGVPESQEGRGGQCALVVRLTPLLSSGGATTRGFGQDVQSLGRDIEKAG
jgi:predicted small secreted protein